MSWGSGLMEPGVGFLGGGMSGLCGVKNMVREFFGSWIFLRK